MLIIDYGMGNIQSVIRAFRELGVKATLSNKGGDLFQEKEGVILPGVGSFGQAMANLRELGLVKPLQDYILSGRPFLGICLGLQVLFSYGEEGGGAEGLNLFPGEVVSFPRGGTLKVPHMGWNRIYPKKPHPLLQGIFHGSYQYFVHSYYILPKTPIGILETPYGQNFVSGIGVGKVCGLQFHPEKGGSIGLKILSNFITICREG